MSLRKWTLSLLGLCTVVGGAYLFSADDAEAFTIVSPFKGRILYSAKFLCGEYQGGLENSDGTAKEGPVKIGNYQTAINVHNPQSVTVQFEKKAILMFDSSQSPLPDFEQPMPPTALRAVSLDPNWGMEIDCDDIRNVLLGQPAPAGQPPPFIKGWVVIELPASFVSRLDVTAAYTSHGFTPRDLDGDGVLEIVEEGFSEDVEQITPTFAF